MSYFKKVKNILNLQISDDLLKCIVFEMSRYFDKSFIVELKRIQKENEIIFDTPSRKMLRMKYYYGTIYPIKAKFEISSFSYSKNDVENTFEDCYNRLNTYNPKSIIESMKKKVLDLESNNVGDTNMKAWLDYYNSKISKKSYSFASFLLTQDYFENHNYDENLLFDFINKSYDGLENYRYLALIVKGEIFDKHGECITWKLLYKAGIYAENFIQFFGKFNAFHKDKQILNLTKFLCERNIKDAKKLASDFYSCISTGFKFEDCYISDNQDCKILILKKIELDSDNVPCPSCNTTIQSGNSFPEMFLKSWECKNPSCPDRSKSGRGKRFDEYGTFRYFKLVENNDNNIVDEKTYQAFRRDVFDHNSDWVEFLLKEYTYYGENVLLLNYKKSIKLFGRNNIEINVFDNKLKENSVKKFFELPIYKLLKSSLNGYLICQNPGKTILNSNIEIINSDSSQYLQNLKEGQIGAAITSPPYYNAREYSQWGTLIMYLVDMLINCKSVFDKLNKGGYYLYNIGDIVSEDNIYVVSNMSKHRIQLGFLSALIFEIAGFNLTGDIIWDKGEVQSKRNSTVNLFSGYVKCVNCYEHVLVFRKGPFEKISNSVKRITPVIKINSKGVNTYKHTAPYPEELVALIADYIDKKYYLLDPFLGSGTTLKWCNNNRIKGLGIELNKEYYELCLKNLRQK